MIVGIMQPYFFPYLGYFQLMKYVDIWVILDRVQFMYPGWINRNRILHPDVRKEWNFITIPLSKRGQFDRICDISIADRKDWRTRLFNKLFVYREAPYYEETAVFVEKCLACPEEKLSAFLKETLASTARKLNITTQILQQGDLEIDPSSVEPGQWALRIARELRASAYVNPPGGIEIYEEANFAASGIDLRFLKPALNAYPQQREKFVPALSIIDVLIVEQLRRSRNACSRRTIPFSLKNSCAKTMREQEKRPAIGGYFELELAPPNPHPFLWPYEPYLYQSARAALCALLEILAPERVWIPDYNCPVIEQPLEILGIDFIKYTVSPDLSISQELSLGKGELLLFINYFGLSRSRVLEVLRTFDPSRVILDYSQAYFDPPEMDCAGTLYSPRKFFGVPDGGLLYTRHALPTPRERDISTERRTQHLLKRIDLSPEAGFADFGLADKSLSDCRPKIMSHLSERILKSIDFEKARKRRQENFYFLHNSLQSLNFMNLQLDPEYTPQCYPLLLRDNNLRELLIAKRIFVPQFWPGLVQNDVSPEIWDLIHNLLPLPLDQRYGLDDMAYLIEQIEEGLGIHD